MGSISALDMQDLINRLRFDLSLDNAAKISVGDLGYLAPLLNWLDTIEPTRKVEWWAISRDDGIAMSGPEQTVREFCARYTQYRPERVEIEGWRVPSTALRGEHPWGGVSQL